MPIPLGELAALGTACCWVVSTMAFSAAGKRIGSLSLNILRLVMAFVMVTIFSTIRRGMPLPLDAPPGTWPWLLLSGFIGFFLGDLCLFRAFVLIGPRVSMLIMALAPPIATIFGFFLLNERISPLGIVGMAITMAGVAWVVLERPDPTASKVVDISAQDRRRGYLLGFGGAFGQALGMILAKIGMNNYDPVASGQIRLIAGIASFAMLLTVIGWWRKTRESIRDKTALAYAAMGSFAGPVVGVSLSLVSIQLTETGIATTIMSTTPVLIIPIVVLTGQERVSARAGLGAIIAVIGVAMLWVR